MVIGFYPGAGGNRYISYLKGQEWTSLGTIYDNKSGYTVKGRGSFLAPEEAIPYATKEDYVVTHSVNSPRIAECFPGHKIVLIRADLKSCLRREWALKGKENNQQNNRNYEQTLIDCFNSIRADSWPTISTFTEYQASADFMKQEVITALSKNNTLGNDEIQQHLNAAYTTICWHHNLYKIHPFDTSCADQIIDINDKTEFTEVIQTELELYADNHLFNFAWQVYEQYGESAPIIDLYCQQFVLLDQD